MMLGDKAWLGFCVSQFISGGAGWGTRSGPQADQSNPPTSDWKTMSLWSWLRARGHYHVETRAASFPLTVGTKFEAPYRLKKIMF